MKPTRAAGARVGFSKWDDLSSGRLDPPSLAQGFWDLGAALVDWGFMPGQRRESGVEWHFRAWPEVSDTDRVCVCVEVRSETMIQLAVRDRGAV